MRAYNITSTMRRVAQAVLALCASAALAFSAAAQETPSASRQEGIGMVTGSLTGTYYKFGLDIAKVAAQEGVEISVKDSNGSIENIKRLNSTENAGLGIVQSDVLGFLARSKDTESQKVARNLRMMFPFYQEEVHVFAPRGIQSFADLEGKRVVVGTEGSGTWLTSMNLFAMMGVKPRENQRLAPPEGVVAVLTGKADAFIFVGGKPVKLFKNLEELAGSPDSNYSKLVKNFHFVPLMDIKMLKEYAASEITPEDYSFLDSPVPTIAVTAVLVSFDFSDPSNQYARERCETLGKIGESLRKHLPEFQASGHPKWKEVDLNREVAYWKRDRCSMSKEVAASTSAAPTVPVTPLENELLKVIDQKW